MYRSLPELIRRIPKGVSLSSYRGEDWKEHVFHNQKTVIYRDIYNSISLISTDRRRFLLIGEVLVLQGQLRLSNGKRLREGDFFLNDWPIEYEVEENSVYLELEK